MQNPELVLMSCCAPCSCDAIRQLKEQGENFVVLFFNPNIFPVAEYQKRLSEQIEFCESLGVQFEAGDYDHSAWLGCIKGLEHNRERGERCSKCFAHRFAFGAEWAKSHGATAITSVFGISPHKSQSQVDTAAEAPLKIQGFYTKSLTLTISLLQSCINRNTAAANFQRLSMASTKRSFRPMFLGPTVNKLLARLGAKTSDSNLAAKWPELIGNDSVLQKISRGVRDRTAYVKANNPSARLLLSYQTSDIVKKINDYFGYNAVAKIVIR